MRAPFFVHEKNSMQQQQQQQSQRARADKSRPAKVCRIRNYVVQSERINLNMHDECTMR